LDIGGLTGIVLYEPDELVLTARAGTRLNEIETALAEKGQCLAFEPPEFATLFGNADRHATLGGIVASGWSGPRRVKAGAVRDHVLGIRAVGGDGRIFNSGGRVVKNVTGFDLPKILTGSHGTLAVMTDITVKVLPAAETSRTLAVFGLEDAAAIKMLSDALGGPYDVSGAAHLPVAPASRSALEGIRQAQKPTTLFRLEGFGPSVKDRLAALNMRLAAGADHIVLDPAQGQRVWDELRDVASLFEPDSIVWRLSLPASDAAATVAAIARTLPVEALYDWGGSLVWLSLPCAPDAHAALVRGILPSGHGTIMRAPVDIRLSAPIFQAQPPALAALARRVKAAFDPRFILAQGRLNPEI